MTKNFWNVAIGLFWAFYVIFLVSSIPHLATWFRHQDGVMTFPADQAYWALAYGKAIAVDGADVLLTLAFLRKVGDMRHFLDGVKLFFIIVCILGFTAFSWYINWQYEVQFVTNEFSRADSLTFLGHNVGHTNPMVGSAFQLFALVFTLISDTILKKSEAKTVEELEAIARDMEARRSVEARIKEAQRANTKASIDGGLDVLSHAKERLLGKTKTPEEMLNIALSFLRDARNLLSIDEEDNAVEALATLLGAKPKVVLPLLIQARAIIEREDHERIIAQSLADQERINAERLSAEERRNAELLADQERITAQSLAVHEEELRRQRAEEEARLARIQAEKEERMERLRLEHEARMKELELQAKIAEEEKLEQARIAEEEVMKLSAEHQDLLAGLNGRDNVSLDLAARYLGYEDTRYVVRLCNDDKLKHPANRKDRITVASLRAYQATKRRGVAKLVKSDEIEQGEVLAG